MGVYAFLSLPLKKEGFLLSSVWDPSVNVLPFNEGVWEAPFVNAACPTACVCATVSRKMQKIQSARPI